MEAVILRSVPEIDQYLNNFDFDNYELVMLPDTHVCPVQSQLDFVIAGDHPTMKMVYYFLNHGTYNYLNILANQMGLTIIFKYCIGCNAEFEPWFVIEQHLI